MTILMSDKPDKTENPAPRGQLSFLGNPAKYSTQKPVAICTLMDDDLRERLSLEKPLENILIGSLKTENIGIEQIITYALGNPVIRFIILCGTDGKRAIGQLPGQSFLALYENGIDDNGRIIGAQGKRPVIQNIGKDAVEHFRNTVEVVDLIGVQDVETVLAKVKNCLDRYDGPADAFFDNRETPRVGGYTHPHMISDPAGYFVIYVDHENSLIFMEHYSKSGVLDLTIEGRTAAELYTPAVDRGLVSRLDHAAYLGKELERAETALLTNTDYVQDASRSL